MGIGSMYKLAVKFLVITVVLTGACRFLFGGHTAALDNNCQGAPHDNWGNDSDGDG